MTQLYIVEQSAMLPPIQYPKLSQLVRDFLTHLH